MNKLGIWVGAILLIVVYFSFNPANSALFPKCPFFYFTEFKCPGCGSQRAVHALLNLDFFTAFGYNALLIVSIPIIIILGYAEINRVRKPRFYLKLHSTKFIWGYFIVVIIWWIFRNIFNW